MGTRSPARTSGRRLLRVRFGAGRCLPRLRFGRLGIDMAGILLRGLLPAAFGRAPRRDVVQIEPHRFAVDVRLDRDDRSRRRAGDRGPVVEAGRDPGRR